MIKLIALDLDGTLFAEDLIISEPVRAAMRDAEERGVHITLASGRMLRSVRPIAAELGIDAPVICYQGSLVYDLSERREIMHYRLAHEVALQAVELAQARGYYANAYIDDNLYVAALNPATEYYSSLNAGLPINPVGDLYRFVAASEHGPTKMSVVLPNEQQTDRMVEAFKQHLGPAVYAVKSYPLFAEIVNPDANKAVALTALVEYMGIKREEVMAIGDGANDIAMLEWAGIGVAMGQAKQPVKAVADYVTASLAEDGVARAIERFVLDGHSA